MCGGITEGQSKLRICNRNEMYIAWSLLEQLLNTLLNKDETFA